MSLINKMLRDLDQRHAPAMDRSGVPSHVRPLPPEPSSFPLWIVPALVVVAAAAWFFLSGPGEPAHVVPSPPVAATTTAPPTQPVVAPPPKAAAAESDVAAPEPVATPKTEPAPIAAAPAIGTLPAKPKKNADPALRLETNLPGVKEKAASAPAAVPSTAVSNPVPPAKDVAAADSASIDKRPRTSAANDAAEVEYRKAMSAVRRGAMAEAAEKLHAALRIDNHHVSARQALLSLLVEQQQWNEAQALMEEGLALDPAQTGWAMALARLQLENGKLADAVETLSHYASHAEQNADYQAFQALLYQKQKRSREAAARYRAALALRPSESRWWYGLGLALEGDQKPQEAREAFLKAKETGNLPPELASAVEQRLR